MDRAHVGIIGLGDIGLPMARRLLEQGVTVVSSAHRRREAFYQLKPLGLIECSSVHEVAEQVEMLLTIVVDDKQTDAVLRGDDGAQNVKPCPVPLINKRGGPSPVHS